MQRYIKNLTLGLIIVIMLAEAAQAQSSVWVIKGARSSIYLAGSCHVLRSSDYPLPDEFETAYIQSPHIIFETPPGDLNTMEYLEKLMAIAVYNDGTTIKEHLTTDVYSKVEKFCNLRNHPFKQYQSFRPWMLSMTLVMREMIVDRNRKWAKKIENLIHGDRSVMVIVGVAHLVGKDSVVDLLRKSGYQVTKLRNGR
ncbi:MAG: hypothetical protein CVU51_11455 [Deltaproteobacteria bacterium HGW-Deltaproteobacteria-1]|nr:MAG: hypothetical protein CVU51_11455 [Deltaproteobacteria bacterium HGW-Deltaproteobacteria-1]